MSEPSSDAPDEKQRRVKKRVRQRVCVAPSRWHRYRKGWRKNRTTILLWCGFALLALVLVLLVLKGYIRSPTPSPPE